MRLNESLLKAGQHVFYENAIWNVEHVNPCRAYIVPTNKKNVVIHDDEGNVLRSFDAKLHGVSIGATSMIPIVDADDVISVRALGGPVKPTLAPATGKPSPKRERPRTPAFAPVAPIPGTLGWHLAAPAPAFRVGSLAATVLAFITANPGRTTQTIVASLIGRVDGNVASCVSRFFQAGLIEKKVVEKPLIAA